MMKKVQHGKYYQLISNTGLFALGNFGSKFLIFFLMPLYTNALTTAEYGISELVITGTNLIIPFVTISIQDATLRFALDKDYKKGEVIKITIIVLALGSLAMIILSPLISLYGAISDWSIYFVIISIVYMIRNAISVYIKAIGMTKLFALDSILYTVLLMVSNILFLVVFNLRLNGYFFAIVLSSLFSIVFLSFFGKIYDDFKSSMFNYKLLKNMIVFSLPMVFNNVSWWMINSSDKIMIEHFNSVSASGIYSVASKMPSLLTTVTSIFNQAWVISSITEYDSTKDENFYEKTFSMYSFLLIICASFIIVMIKPFMKIYVGESFISSWKYVPLLLLGSIFQSYAMFFGAIYTSAKKNINVMNTTFLAAGINILLNLLLIPIIGIQGAVIATAVAYFVVFIYRMFNSQKYLKFRINYLKTSFSLLVLICQCLFAIYSANEYHILLLFFLIQILIYYKYIKSLTLKIIFKINK